jgi:endo-1,3-1,4-beta-glycanase ExoK
MSRSRVDRRTAEALIPLLALTLSPSPGVALTEPVPVEIASFRPESRTLEPGGAAVSELVVRNGSDRARVLWIGYSVQDPMGAWYDVPAHAVSLAPGETSAPQRKEWQPPREPAPPGGSYRVVMAVWSASPGTPGAERLASADRPAAFRLSPPAPPEISGPWRTGSHALGRGRLRPGNVLADGAGFRLRLPAGRCDGAEVRSADPVYYGEYSIRMRTPDAPGSLSAFFLYQDVRGGNDEIDLEIYNDGSRRVLLTAWSAGKAVHEEEATLPFDPAADHHDYTIRWSRGEIVFFADGAPLRRWTSRIPASPMRVMANAWWPTWLPCEAPPTARELRIESIRLLPLTVPS